MSDDLQRTTGANLPESSGTYRLCVELHQLIVTFIMNISLHDYIKIIVIITIR